MIKKKKKKEIHILQSAKLRAIEDIILSDFECILYVKWNKNAKYIH